MDRFWAVLLVVVIISSGCAEKNQSETGNTGGPDKPGFEELRQSGLQSSYKANYSLDGSEASEVSSIQVLSTGEKRQFSAQYRTPGGDYVVDTYELDNRTVQCEEDEGTCILEDIQHEIHRPLKIDRWELSNISETGEKTVAGEECRKFSAEPENLLQQGFVSSEKSQIKLCLNDDGVISEMTVSGEDGTMVNYTLQEYEDFSGNIELSKPLEIIGHCSGSFEVDITPLREIDSAEISINDFTQRITLPAKFEVGIYSIPEKSIKKGVNDLTVTTDQSSQTIECFRRN